MRKTLFYFLVALASIAINYLLIAALPFHDLARLPSSSPVIIVGLIKTPAHNKPTDKSTHSLRKPNNRNDANPKQKRIVTYQRLPEPLSAPDLSVVNGLESAVGMATFKVCVDEAGDVVSSTVISTAIFTSGDINKMVLMIHNTKFIPALRDNKAVPGCIKIKINLTQRLQGGNATAAALHP